jgi:hypothetical protein
MGLFGVALDTKTQTKYLHHQSQMDSEDVISNTASSFQQKMQSALKNMFSPKVNSKAKQVDSIPAIDAIQKSAITEKAVDKTHSIEAVQQQQTNSPKISGTPKVIRYKHMSVQTAPPICLTAGYATDDIMEAEEVLLNKLAEEKALDRQAKLVTFLEQDNKLPEMLGNVSIRQSSKLSTDSICLPKTRARFIKFDRVAVLLDAAANGDMGELRMLLEGDCPLHVDSCTSVGLTALHAACSNGEKYPVKYLLSLGAQVNVADSNGNTPLHIAAGKGYLELVQALVSSGGNVEALNGDKQTPSQCSPFSDIREFLHLVAKKKIVSDRVNAIFDFNKHTVLDGKGDEVSMQRGEELIVIDRSEPDWWLVEKQNGERGYVPRTMVQ